MTKEQKERVSKIWDNVKYGLEKGYNASKKGLKKAGGAIQKFSDKSVVVVEKKQAESKRKKTYIAIGEFVAKKLSTKNAKPLTSTDSDISDMLKDVAKYNKVIAQCEKKIKEFEKLGGGKDAEKPVQKTKKKTSVKK